MKRTFGQDARHAIIVTMDDDLQHRPSEIGELPAELKSGDRPHWATDGQEYRPLGVRRHDPLHSRLLEILAVDALPVRPGRSEPRAVKKRPKPYPLLTTSRHRFKALPHKGKPPAKRPQVILT